MAALTPSPTERVPALAKLRRLLGGLSPEMQGLLGVLLIGAVLGLLNVFMLPQFRAADEPRHVSYSILLADGTWPKVTDPLPLARLGVKKIMDSGVYVAAANHPPLYYWLVALPLKIGADRHNLLPGLQVARVITLLFAIASLVYMFRIVKLLWPGRPVIALTTALFLAVLPTYSNTAGIVYNDTLGVLTCLGAFHAALVLLVNGPTRGRIVATGVWMALAMFTRISGLFVVAPAMLVTFVAMLRHSDGKALRRVLRASAVCAALVAGILATSGWFYYRNYKLYGDITGSAALFKLFGRKPNGTPLELLLSARRWASMFDLLWTRLAGHVKIESPILWVARVVSAGGAILALKSAWHRRRRLLPRAFAAEPRAWGMVACVLAFVCVVVPMFVFHARGGNLNLRYLLPVAWVPMMIIAVGLASMRSPVLSLWGATSIFLTSLLVHELYARSIVKRSKAIELGVSAALTEVGTLRGAGWTIAYFTLLALGFSLFARAVVALHRRVDEPLSAPADPVPAPAIALPLEPAIEPAAAPVVEPA